MSHYTAKFDSWRTMQQFLLLIQWRTGSLSNRTLLNPVQQINVCVHFGHSLWRKLGFTQRPCSSVPRWQRHNNLHPWIKSLDLFQNRRVAIVSWGVHDLFFLTVCIWGRFGSRCLKLFRCLYCKAGILLICGSFLCLAKSPSLSTVHSPRYATRHTHTESPWQVCPFLAIGWPYMLRNCTSRTCVADLVLGVPLESSVSFSRWNILAYGQP
jgi:hypothetical protein